MDYQLAQLNLAKFRVPADDPVNADFVNNLDRVNAIAESQPGFVWHFQAIEGSNVAVNMSIWTDIQSLEKFVYQNDEHKNIMRRRKEWFERVEFYMVIWWIEEGHRPSIVEAKNRLEMLRRNGPAGSAFTFKKPYAAPTVSSN